MFEIGCIRFLEFFTANIRNPNPLKANARASGDFLSWWAERGGDRPARDPADACGGMD